MTETFDNLHVMGVTSDGKVWHTMRDSMNAWVPFTEVPTGGAGPAVDVACVRCVRVAPETAPLTEGLWALIAYQNTPPRLHFRNSDTSQWQTVPNQVLPLPIAKRVAVTLSPGVAPPSDPNPGSPRAYVHMVVIADGVLPTDQGRLIAAVMPNRGAGGNYSSAIAEVQTSGAGDLGSATALALAPADVLPPRPPGQESVASLAVLFEPDGALFFTQGGVSVSGATSQWDPFRARDLAPPAGPGARPGRLDDVALTRLQAGAAITDPNEYMVVARGGGDADVYGATLSVGGWTEWENYELFKILGYVFDLDPGNFQRVSISKNTQGLHVTGVAQGKLLHQYRPTATPALGVFRDVEQDYVANDVGIFIAAACG